MGHIIEKFIIPPELASKIKTDSQFSLTIGRCSPVF